MIGKKINQLATELAPVSTDLTIIGDPISGVSKKITLAQLGAIFSGAVSFYTNLASFPAVGDINVIYCAKDTQKLYLWSGSAYTEVFPSQALLNTYQLRSEKGVSNGYASLDSGGKVPISQLPSSIMEYKGTWNAATNTPTLANGTGDTGDVFVCNVAGSVNFGAGPITFAVGDYVIYSGSIWQRSSGAVGTVTSVGVTRSGDALAITGSPITTSGTINLGFAGTNLQYINGAGNLVTFPGIISQAQNLITEVYNKTGATLTKGTIVYISGGQGNLPSVSKALATGDSTSAQTYGIVQNDITNNNNGFVVAAGRLSDLNTQAFTEGTQLYLSPTTAGTYQSTKPYAPQHLVYVAIVVRAHPTQGVIEVKIQNGYEMDELHNVAAQTPSNNDGLFWEASTSLWKNKSIATILGYTPQAQLNGTGFVKASGTTISYDNSTYVTTDTFQTISASKTFGVGFSLASAGGTNQLTSFVNTNSIHSGSAGTNIFGFNNSNNIYFGKGLNNGGVITYNNAAVRFYAFPDADGTIALVGGSGVGTVTSVAALTLGTSGTDLSSTVANGTTTPVITLNVPTASATNRGALSSADWTTFNNKQNALTNPVTGSGTTNFLPKFTGASTIGNSSLQDDGSNVFLSNGYYISTRTDNTSALRTHLLMQRGSGAGTYADIFTSGDASNGVASMQFGFNSSAKMILTASGNLGLGVTPSAWWSEFKAIQFGSVGSVYSGSGVTVLGHNTFFDGTNSKRLISNPSSLYIQTAGQHLWLNAGDGSAGTNISFTQAMTLNASGNLSVGNTNDSFKLDVSGTGRFTGALTAAGALFTAATETRGNIRTTFSSDNSYFSIFSNDGALTLDTYGVGGFMNFKIAGTPALTIASTGAATFSSTLTSTDLTIKNSANAETLDLFLSPSALNAFIDYPSGRSLNFRNKGSGLGLSLSSIGLATFTGLVRVESSYIQIVNSTNPSLYINNNVVQWQNYVKSNNNIAFSDAVRDVLTLGYNGSASFFQGCNVGIGTTSPASRLHVETTSSNPFRMVRTADSTSFGFEFGGGDIGLYNYTNLSYVWYAKGNGNVGIGTTSPTTKLDVNGDIKTGEPDTGYGRAAVKIGTRQSGAAFGVGGYIPVSIDGTVYFINLQTSTP